MFWAPEVLPTVLSVSASSSQLVLTDRSGSNETVARRVAAERGRLACRAAVRWATHRVWMKELPAAGASQAIELPLNSSFELRAQAAHSLWRTLSGRSPGRPPSGYSPQRRQRFALLLRALDGRNENKSYRAIAEGLFGKKRIPDRAWKTHDLRNRTIRLVQRGLALMRGGYRKLLRPRRKDK